MDKGLWETPNQTTDSGQDKKSRFNEVRLKAQLYRVYRVYIGKALSEVVRAILGNRT